jgi:hypothetical protein
MISALKFYELWMDNLAFKERGVLVLGIFKAFEEGTNMGHSFDDLGNGNMAWLASFPLMTMMIA